MHLSRSYSDVLGGRTTRPFPCAVATKLQLCVLLRVHAFLVFVLGLAWRTRYQLGRDRDVNKELCAQERLSFRFQQNRLVSFNNPCMQRYLLARTLSSWISPSPLLRMEISPRYVSSDTFP